MGLNARNDTKVRAEFIVVNYESFTGEEIETDGFFITKDISTIGAQLIHTNDDIEAFYGNRHKVDWEGMIV